ncbi:S8 family serine peptidase [Cytobacillus gottheilii]|uniref:S8 family serine peptidase n=1 Tax=Cytobacillus gottheilii TaxID=859144 RepID=UPI0009BA0F24|nr:S8 family serine peptidase [Cytobacillus gottheilii]
MSPKKTTGKKVASSLLAGALVLSSFNFSAFAESAPTDKYAAKIEQFKKAMEGKSSVTAEVGEEQKVLFNKTDKVRVIVEVEGQTPVEVATKEGKLYKELSEDKKDSITSKLLKQQTNVKDKIKAKGVSVDYNYSFATAFNGFSGEVTYGDISKIESVAGVKNVYLANEYNRPELPEPDMHTSHEFIQSHQTWADAKFKGEGMVVAVIDSGVDPSHKDFVLTDSASAELSSAEVSGIVDENGLKGQFFTDKVPYGYNYYDQNNTILDLGPEASEHGMHVAGTVAANGDVANGGIKGVAPEAQVLGMKVFSNDPNYPSTWSDVYLAAIDDSIKLGADVLNMSLGSTASFYNEESAEDLAITRAVENGIVASVSAGNSGHIARGWDDPYYKNPDIGVVGAPGLNTDTIQVAASGNVAYEYETGITVPGTDFSGTGYGVDSWVELEENNQLELVSLDGKLGHPEDYNGIDVEGKVVVMPRGDLTFVDKTKNAAEAGAIGIIVYNSTSPIFYTDQGGWQIPFMKISRQEGLALEEAIKTGNTTLDVNQLNREASPEMGRMTEFTSWGTTPSLELKPEITAPGGKIISTLQNDEYGEMSGTSMAAPHVAGGSALVQQYLQGDERFNELSTGEKTRLAKVLLMNTADVILDENAQPFSPRRQGAGMMQTYSAVDTPVYVTDAQSGEAKVELKDFTEKQFSMTLTATNISDKDVTYNVDANVLSDMFYEVEGSEDYNALIAGDLEGAVIDAPEKVTVSAGDSAEFTVSVDLTNAKVPGFDANDEVVLRDLTEDNFVEGFVTLTDENGIEATLSVPYVGFYGKWDRPEIVDGFTELGENRFYELPANFNEMLTGAGGSFVAQAGENEFYPVSPNGDGENDDIYPLPSFLRNADEVQFNILDEEENFLRRVKLEKDVTKNYYNAGNGSYYSFNSSRAWDGKVKSETVEDGLYYYEIKSVIDYDGAEWQSKKIPVYVDTTAPEITAVLDEEAGVVSWETVEEGTGVASYGVFVNGSLVKALDSSATSYQFDSLPEKAVIEIGAVDYASNYGFDTAAKGDAELPLLYVDTATPEPFGAYNSFEVPVAGYVQEDLALKTLTVNGKDVEFTFDAATNRYNFSTKATFEKDGKYDIIITATDHSDKEFSISRKVFIDTTLPEINVETPQEVGKDVEEVKLSVNLKDNYNFLSLYVDDTHEFEQPLVSPVDVMTPADTDVEVNLPVKVGENKFTLRLIDLAGNEVTKEVDINRLETDPKNGWVLEGGKWFFYDEDVKETGWLLDQGKWYYLNGDGAMATGWVKDQNKWYYLSASGVMQTGWVQNAGKWYLLSGSGAMQTGWVKSQNTWYFLDKTSGAMATGWLKEGGVWYYFKSSGTMVTGWNLINGKWYYFYASGTMAANTTVGGYKLGPSGAWTGK